MVDSNTSIASKIKKLVTECYNDSIAHDKVEFGKVYNNITALYEEYAHNGGSPQTYITAVTEALNAIMNDY